MHFKGAFYIFALLSIVYTWLKGYELIYTRTLEVAFVAGLLKRKCIFEAHAPYLSHSKLKRKVFSYCLKMKSIQKIVVISQKLQSIIEESYDVSSAKFQVLHDAGEVLNVNPRTIAPNKNFDIGYFGSLYEGRGIELICEIAKKSPNHKFHIYGGSFNEVIKYKELSKNLSNISFYGFIEPQKINSIMQTMDVLLAPYQKKVLTSGGHDSSQWMSPIKIFEYMSLGIPMICSDLPVLREVLVDEENALMCDSESAEDWSLAIQKLTSSESLYKKISINSKNAIKNEFNWDLRVQLLLNKHSQKG